MNPRWLLAVAVAAVVALFAGCERKPAAKRDDAGNSPVTAPLDYLAAQGKARKFAEKTISAAELTSAIQKFNAMEDRFPADLNELVREHYLRGPPAAPTGMRWDYNPQTGAVRPVTAAQSGPAPAQR
jgi:hypothetical protein